MKTILSSQTMDIPEGVKVKVRAKIVEVEGPRGKLTRNFKHLNLDFQLIEEGRKLKVDASFGTSRTMAAIRTAISHVQNLITGVTKGYRDKMRPVYAHFPINASINNNNTSIEIRNFLGEKKSDSEEEEVGHKGVTKFTHGCRAFRMAFTKVMKKSAQADHLLGPILSVHRKLVAKKLAEEVDEQNAKGDAKERHLAAEKGHVKPADFLDSKEKFLVSVATKGVVRLFNAVNKSQNPQKGLNPSRSKDAKELAKRRKKAFLSGIKKSDAGGNDKYSSFGSIKVSASTGDEDQQPGWAPLRDSYMLTSSRLKDWDKRKDSSTPAGTEIRSLGSSSDED